MEQKDNSGALFVNTKKLKDTHPNMTGQVKIDGKEYWVSAWTKESDKVGKYQSLSFTPKEEKQNHKPQKAVEQPIGDDIPF